LRILALDATTEACSVALLDADAPLDLDAPLAGDALIWRYEELGKGHADRILGMVDEVLGQAGLRLAALDAIAASIGPGAFTGVRITVAAAQGLAFGAALPIVPVSTLEALALQAMQGEAAREALARGPGDDQRVLACLDARMGEVYWGCFARDALRGVRATSAARVSAPSHVSLADGLAHRGIGRGFSAYSELMGLAGLELATEDRQALPQAQAIARLGYWRLRAGDARDPADVTPLYLRDKVALTEAERGVT